jgi:hypothetical protein
MQNNFTYYQQKEIGKMPANQAFPVKTAGQLPLHEILDLIEDQIGTFYQHCCIIGRNLSAVLLGGAPIR